MTIWLEGGGYGFLFRSEIFFQTTQELEYFFLSRQAQFFFPKFNISNIGNQNIFFRKKPSPPLQVKWSFP